MASSSAGSSSSHDLSPSRGSCSRPISGSPRGIFIRGRPSLHFRVGQPSIVVNILWPPEAVSSRLFLCHIRVMRMEGIEYRPVASGFIDLFSRTPGPRREGRFRDRGPVVPPGVHRNRISSEISFYSSRHYSFPRWWGMCRSMCAFFTTPHYFPEV